MALLWATLRERGGFAEFAKRAAAQLIRWESRYGWTRTGTGKVSQRETSLAAVLADMLRVVDAWVGFADAYLDIANFLLERTASELPVILLTPGNPLATNAIGRFLAMEAPRLGLTVQVVPALSQIDVILSANVPVTNWLFLNTKIAAYRSYALCATTQKPVLPGLYWDSLDPYHYIRNYQSDKIGDCLIIGGEDHKTGTTANTDECFARLERYAREHFDITEIECRWSGQIINPVDGLAYIGLNSMAKHVYVSTGYSGNGLTYGTLGGMIIADAISGRENRFAPVYQATRVHAMASIGKFISENVDTPVHFIADRLSNNIAQSVDEIKFNEGALLKCNGETLAAYRDENGELHTCSAVCPHMGCLVQWNAAETSWDCPCHGSRFDKNGKLQNGPAIADLKPCDAVMDEIPAIA